MTARWWCCHTMARRGVSVVAAGFVGIVGFVGAMVALAASGALAAGCLVATSLIVYAAALAISSLGDPFELPRPTATGPPAAGMSRVAGRPEAEPLGDVVPKRVSGRGACLHLAPRLGGGERLRAPRRTTPTFGTHP